MALANNALMIVEEYDALFAQKPSSTQDETKRAQVEFDINAASDWIETETNRTTFLSGSLGTDIWTGLGYDRSFELKHNEYKPKDRPIVGTPVLEYWTGTAWTAVTATWAVDPTSNYIYFTDGSYFAKGIIYRLRYEYGYGGIAEVPYDLKLICGAVVKYFQHLGKHMGIDSTGGVGGSSTKYTFAMPKMITNSLEKYK